MSALFVQPRSLSELEICLPRRSGKTLVLAGGTDLLPELRSKRPEYDGILSLCKIPELKEISVNGDWLRIGSMVTHTQAADDTRIKKYFAALHMACSHVGSQQIRNKGTLGGNVMNSSPAGDIAPCLFLFSGELELMDKDGVKRVPAEEFFRHRREHDGEILLALYLPLVSGRQSCFVKLGTRRVVTIAQISLCAAWSGTGPERRVTAAYAGAIDRTPVALPHPALLSSHAAAVAAAEELRRLIRTVRQNRSRPPKLKITEAEQLYKERAALGAVCDLIDAMETAEKNAQQN